MVTTSYLYNNGDVTNLLLPLCRICVEYIRLDTCAKFDDRQSNNNKVIIAELGGGLMNDGSNNPMSNTEIRLMVQDSALTFQNLPFCCPKSTCSLLTFKPTGAIFTDRSEERQSGNI